MLRVDGPVRLARGGYRNRPWISGHLSAAIRRGAARDRVRPSKGPAGKRQTQREAFRCGRRRWSSGSRTDSKKSFRTRSIPLSCAGMGGDLIQKILSQCPWRRTGTDCSSFCSRRARAMSCGAGCVRTGLRFSARSPCRTGIFYIPSWPSGRAQPAPLTPGTEYASPAVACKQKPAGGNLSCARGERLAGNGSWAHERGKAAPRAAGVFWSGAARNSGNEEKLCRASVKFTTFCLTLRPLT